MLKIICVHLNGFLDESKFSRLMSCISTEKQGRISRLHRYDDAQRALIGDILIRYMLCQMLKIKNNELIFRVNKYGKPFLFNRNDIQFNISHSGKWVACAICDCQVGIDVEQIKPVDMSIAEQFFSKDEVDYLMNKNITERITGFYDLWTLKESYIKAVGKGLSIPLDSFTIKINNGDITISPEYGSHKYFFKQYYIDKGYKMAICSRKNEFPGDARFMDINDLYKEILLL